MSMVEMAVEKIRQLDDAHARQLLVWLESQTQPATTLPEPLGAMAMLGFARRFRPKSHTTEDWMAELRAGERE